VTEGGAEGADGLEGRSAKDGLYVLRNAALSGGVTVRVIMTDGSDPASCFTQELRRELECIYPRGAAGRVVPALNRRDRR